MGDKLVVSITADAFVYKEGRPIYPELERMEIVKALRCVDEVLIVRGLQDALRKVQPDILVKGSDYQQGIESSDREYCERNGIHVRITTTPKYSTSETINEIRRRS